jgi:primosomal protein N' (replication factor Y)
VLIGVRSPHQGRAQFSTETLARRLKEGLPEDTVLGEPAPAPLEKAHGAFRYQLVLRSKRILNLSRHLKAVLEKLTFPEDVIVTVDVDAYQLL